MAGRPPGRSQPGLKGPQRNRSAIHRHSVGLSRAKARRPSPRAKGRVKAAGGEGGLAERRNARSIGDVASGQEEEPEKRGQAGIVIARPFGIPVYVSPYWFIIAAVFIVIYANDLSYTLHGGDHEPGAAVPVRARARAEPLDRRPRLRAAGTAHPAVPARRRLRDREGTADPHPRVPRVGRGPGGLPAARRGGLGADEGMGR